MKQDLYKGEFVEPEPKEKKKRKEDCSLVESFISNTHLLSALHLHTHQKGLFHL